ncbi:tail protein [Xenorhabdus mauleonii]|uniref:Phage tail-collar fibre protein n=1 Tax=Xenorhabdus mauleonii TaxID=351675 RepID=A0A1I3R950_9GAMM|nr:phage tail protein [Xenorhabdus mauleonii]PHM39809.1 tail protein [Xenorhabdus mauleonii]SFJ43154.1 Phage tail-collar fibre protein [Xenorhabdus mauleonii]
MSSVITVDFERWKAQQVAAGNSVVLDEFVFAYVPDLDPAKDISRSEKLPDQNQIVHRQAVNKTGLASENAVAYSVTLGTEVGDFDFNWIGLLNKGSGVIGMITHAPTQKKIKTANGLQGNVLTRSFLLEFEGAAKETAITTTAETWQIDFTARLSGMDEMQRLINTDSYGEAAFFEDGFAVIRKGEQYTVKKGLAYVGGLRGVLEFDQTLNSMRNTRVYADFSYQGNLVSQWKTVVKITVANELKNYVDAAGYPHYVFAIAQIDGNGNISDLRPKGALSDRDIAMMKQEIGKVKLDYATNTALNEVRGLANTANQNATHASNNANTRLEKGKNLSDLANKVLARQALALKSAAIRDVTQSQSDTTAGHLVQVGDYGFGIANGDTESLRSIYDITCTRLYRALGQASAAPTEGMPENSGNIMFSVLALNIYAGQYWVTLTSTNQFYVGMVNTDSKTVSWVQHYSPTFKPSAADIGAQPKGSYARGDLYTAKTDASLIYSPNKRAMLSIGDTGWLSLKGETAKTANFAVDSTGIIRRGLATIATGGTEATTAAQARINLGLSFDFAKNNPVSYTLPGGLILKAGFGTTTEHAVSVTFIKAFPHTCIAGGPLSAEEGTNDYVMAQGVSRNKNGLTLAFYRNLPEVAPSANIKPLTYSWFAIGY